jgi:DNA-binding NarL/FixJ family response regulator
MLAESGVPVIARQRIDAYANVIVSAMHKLGLLDGTCAITIGWFISRMVRKAPSSRKWQAIGLLALAARSLGTAQLVDAIRAVHAGQLPLPHEVASCLAERIPCPELSPRELEILKRIANGESNKELAVRLGISEGTVRVHASNVFAKLGCSDRAQAVAVAFHRGIIAIE